MALLVACLRDIVTGGGERRVGGAETIRWVAHVVTQPALLAPEEPQSKLAEPQLVVAFVLGGEGAAASRGQLRVSRAHTQARGRTCNTRCPWCTGRRTRAAPPCGRCRARGPRRCRRRCASGSRRPLCLHGRRCQRAIGLAVGGWARVVRFTVVSSVVGLLLLLLPLLAAGLLLLLLVLHYPRHLGEVHLVLLHPLVQPLVVCSPTPISGSARALPGLVGGWVGGEARGLWDGHSSKCS